MISPPAFALDVHHIPEVVHDLLAVAAAAHMRCYLCPVLAIQGDALSDFLPLIVCEGPLALCQLVCPLDLEKAGHGSPACAKRLSSGLPLHASANKTVSQPIP